MRIEMPPQTFLQSSTNVAVLIFRTAVPTAVLIRIEFEVEMLPEVFCSKIIKSPIFIRGGYYPWAKIYYLGTKKY
jgi:hypothetical protein